MSFAFIITVVKKSDSLGNESNESGSDSGSSGPYTFGAFPLRDEDPVADVLRLTFSHQ